MNPKKSYYMFIAACMSLFPTSLLASVEGSLENVQKIMVGKIGTLVAVLGFIFAGFSYITGNPNARTHLILAVTGACVLFGASSIVSFIQNLIH